MIPIVHSGGKLCLRWVLDKEGNDAYGGHQEQ